VCIGGRSAIGVGGVEQDAQLLGAKIIGTTHGLGIQDGEVRAPVLVHIVDVGQLVALWVHGVIVRVALAKGHLRRIPHRDVGLHLGAVDALEPIGLTTVQLVPKVKSRRLGVLTGLVVVLDVELLQIVSRQKVVVAKAVAVPERHHRKAGIGHREHVLVRILVDDLHVHGDLAGAEIRREHRRDVRIEHHVLPPVAHVLGGKGVPVGPLHALAHRAGDLHKVIADLPILDHVRDGIGQVMGDAQLVGHVVDAQTVIAHHVGAQHSDGQRAPVLANRIDDLAHPGFLGQALVHRR